MFSDAPFKAIRLSDFKEIQGIPFQGSLALTDSIVLFEQKKIIAETSKNEDYVVLSGNMIWSTIRVFHNKIVVNNYRDIPNGDWYDTPKAIIYTYNQETKEWSI
jgi:hypothetical protein